MTKKISPTKPKKITWKQWNEEGKKLFGADKRKWKFVCPSCGHIQSVESMIKNNPKLSEKDLEGQFCFSCEGRHTEGRGCDWTLGGFLQIQTVTIVHEGEDHPVFDFFRE